MRNKDSQKGFAPIVIILAIVILLGAGAGYFWFLNQKPQDPQLLIGLWVTKSSIFPDGEYLEIKEKEFCFMWSGDSPAHFRCSQYALYTVSKNLVGFGEQSQRNMKWRVTGNTLTVDWWQSGEERVYERVSYSENVTPKQMQTSFPEESIFTRDPDGNVTLKPTLPPRSPSSINDSEKPKITLFKASSLSVKAGDEITFTCSATDNSGSVLIVFDFVGAGGSAKAFEGGPFRSSGESHVYSYSPLRAPLNPNTF